MGSRTITNKEYENLIKKSKAGWAAYYAECRDSHQRDTLYIEAIHDLKLKLENENQMFPVFLQQELRDLMVSLKKQIECPI